MTEPMLAAQIECLDAPSQLFEALNQSGVRYCNWKSSIRIPEGLQGRTDLDLLVDPGDTAAFRQILSEHDLKLTRPAPGKAYPGIENYLGFDPHDGRLFHLHVHYQLVLGEQFVKNYHLPIEAAFLDHTVIRHSIKAPRPEVEIIVLCLRALLKYRDRDALKDTLPLLRKLGKRGGLPEAITAELCWLLGQTTLAQVAAQLTGWREIIPGDAVLGLLRMIAQNQPAGRKLWQYRGMVRRGLRDYQRRDRLAASLSYFREDWRRKRRIFKPHGEKKMTFEGGGPRIAFVGVDGSGKSTITARAAKWLSWRVSVGMFYMGKTRDTLPAKTIRPLIKLARMAHSFCSRHFGAQSLLARLTGEPKKILENLAALMQGQARLHAYQESRRRADNGTVVLYDRYPLSSVWLDNYPLDGPRIPANPGRMKSLQVRLERSEAELYRQIQLPDHVILLRVSPDVLHRRRPEDNEAVLAAKAGAIEAITPDGFGLTVIDAELPLQDVLARVKQVVWNLL